MRGREGLAFLKKLNMPMSGGYRGPLNKPLVRVSAGAGPNAPDVRNGVGTWMAEIFQQGGKAALLLLAPKAERQQTAMVEKSYPSENDPVADIVDQAKVSM